MGLFKKDRERKGKRLRNSEVTMQVLPTEEYAVETALATHIGAREYQQDAAYVSESVKEEDAVFGVLCDGMGGMESGELASADVVEFMANRILSILEEDGIPAALERAAHDANELIVARDVREGVESGTTMVAVLLKGGQLYWVSVGDSRIYIVRDGEIARMTRDHNYALQLQEMVDVGCITQEQADGDPQREALVSYIGAPELELVDAGGGFLLERGDVVLLCSDGLTKTLSDERILSILERYAGDLQEAARVLPIIAFDENSGGQDNTSVILIGYNAEGKNEEESIESSKDEEIDRDTIQIETRSGENEPGKM